MKGIRDFRGFSWLSWSKSRHLPRNKAKRYIGRRWRESSVQVQLEQAIRKAIAHVPMQVVLLEQLDSWAVPGLQAVDFVAWSFEQKHGLGEDWAAKIIAEKVVVEEKVRGTNWIKVKYQLNA